MTISGVKLYATHEHPCSYLRGRHATTVFVDPDAPIDKHLYSELSDFGFRRSGRHIYKPHCRSCQACIPVRIPVANFHWKRNYRRNLQRNADLEQRVRRALTLELHYPLYERYINARHADGDMYPPSREQFTEFLSAEWQTTEYLEYWLGSRLMGVSVTDRLEQGLSAIYTFYEPDEGARGLGTFAILQQILTAQRDGLPYVYLGYWIRDCDKMRYKQAFRPIELYMGNRWLSFV